NDWPNPGPTKQFAAPVILLAVVQHCPSAGVILTQVPVAPSQRVPAGPGVPLSGELVQVTASLVYPHTLECAQQTKGAPQEMFVTSLPMSTLTMFWTQLFSTSA